MAAWMLLAVFVPILLLSSIHIHETGDTTTTECNDCVHHSCHGHLSSVASWDHDCVLCQFLTMSFVTTSILAVVYYKKVNRIHFAQLQSDIHFEEYGIPQLRAPPFV